MGTILSYLLMPFSHPILLVVLAIGAFVGVYVGAIPGLTGTMAVSLLVSLTFGWDTNIALAAMIGVYNGAVFGGSRSAILLNIPGAPAAVATVFDGYPLALKGRAAEALGITTTASVVGAILGTLSLAIFAPMLSNLSLKFGPMDYFLLAIMGMLMVGTIGSKSPIKGLLPAALGVFLGRVGMDNMTGIPRFTYGNVYLLSGISSVVAMIGLYGVSESLSQLGSVDTPPIKQKVDKIVPTFGIMLKHLSLTIRSSIIGIIVGALPGAGGSVSALLAYDHAKRTTKNPEVPFGEGAIEGLVAPETANNAAVGGAFIPMLTLGIPGDAVTAVIMGALMIHGLKPGPMLMTEQPHLFYLVTMLLFISCLFLLFFGLTGIKAFAKLVEIPRGRLMPLIIVLSVTGAFAINNLLFDIYWMVGFGIVGYILKRYGYPASPMVLGIILGGLLETNFRRAITTAHGLLNAILGIFTSPISFVLFMIIVFSMVAQTKWYKAWKAKRAAAKGAAA
jgi:putative tricarboxylic transport membrane protein